jgi:hypothetical protein
MSKIKRPRSGSEAKKLRARIARKRWRTTALAVIAKGDGSHPEGVNRMRATELRVARGFEKAAGAAPTPARS